MNKSLISILSVGILCASFVQLSKPKASKPTLTEPAKVFTQYCSSCHGEKIEAFVDRSWKHGTSKEEVVASISNGYLDLGMPAWKGVVDKKDINLLAEEITKYIGKVNEYKVSNKPTTIELVDLQGRSILKTIIKSGQSQEVVEMEKLSTGTYFIHAQQDDKQSVMKVMKIK